MEFYIITIGLILFAVLGIGIKIWTKKDGKFAGTCASQSPFLNKKGESCGYCGKTPDQFENCSEPAHN
ncbi:MAG: membrane or secreted protein [Flavobacteriaceae bacterium]|nr:membrane or secreted protein [Flavobacteriaceae bacterium]